MQKYKPLILLLLTVFVAACNADKEYQNVGHSNNLTCNNMKTYCENNKEIFQKAHVYLEQDTLFIRFFNPPPAGWEGVIIKVHDGKFHAVAYRVPFTPVKILYTTLKQRLQLGKKHYMMGDTLCGYCSFRFRAVETPMFNQAERKKETTIFSFHGTIR